MNFCAFHFSLYYFSHVAICECGKTTDPQSEGPGFAPSADFSVRILKPSPLPKTSEMWKLLCFCGYLEPMLSCCGLMLAVVLAIIHALGMWSSSWMLQLHRWISSFHQVDSVRKIRWSDLPWRNIIIISGEACGYYQIIDLSLCLWSFELWHCIVL